MYREFGALFVDDDLAGVPCHRCLYALELGDVVRLVITAEGRVADDGPPCQATAFVHHDCRDPRKDHVKH